MEIFNHSDTDASWFCYNSDDDLKWVALGSGDLSAMGGRDVYNPPKNKTGLYFVRFTRRGGGSELAGGTTEQAGQAIRLLGSGGQYHALVVESAPVWARR
jgi:hypothetical protein